MPDRSVSSSFASSTCLVTDTHVPVPVGDVASAVADGIGVPPFFCPILRDGEFTLAQTPAIMEFLGRKHGCKRGCPMTGHMSGFECLR